MGESNAYDVSKQGRIRMRFVALKDLPLEQVSKSYTRRSLIGETEMITWATLQTGAHGKAHHHIHEQAFWIMKGRMKFRIENEYRTCVAGDLVLVAPNEEHEVWCEEECDFLTLLSPVRQDLLPGAGPPAHMMHDK